jgi:hypothetical protein
LALHPVRRHRGRLQALPDAAHPLNSVSLYARWLFLGANFRELRKGELRRMRLPHTRGHKPGSGLLLACASHVQTSGGQGCSGLHVAYEEELSPSSREARSTPMTATKNNVPPSSALVMTVLVLRTSPSRKPCTLRSSRSLPEHRAYTPRLATS